MRKQTKLVAVLSAAALLAIGASMTSFAATPHWDQQDGEWVYLDRDGERVTGEWKKSNGQWYYLDDENGYMAKDQIIDFNEDRFYVDANGVKVTNAWVAVDNDDLLDDDDVTTVWFWFDSKGKAAGYGDDADKVVKSLPYGDGQKGYFMFDNEGCMLSGWQNLDRTSSDGKTTTYTYFLGDENQGWALTGWQYLDADDDDVFDGSPYDEEKWFYFDSKGKAKKGKTDKIAGLYYAFDENGALQTNWLASPWSPLATDSSYYDDINGIGNREKGWIYTYAPNESNSYWDDEFWFYLEKDGVPFNFGKDAQAAKIIKNQTYLFDEDGKMLDGIQKLDAEVDRVGGKDLVAGTYYFSEEDGSAQGQMLKNKKVTVEDEGTFYLSDTGRAYENVIINGYVYGNDGALVEDFGDGTTYEVVNLSEIADKLIDKKKNTLVEGNVQVVVNGNGKIKKTGYITIEGVKYKVNNYVATVED